MAGDPQQKTINGVTYEVSPFGCRQGLRILTTLTKMLGPAAKELTRGESGALAAVGAMAETLDPDQVLSLAETFAEFITVQMGDKKPRLKDVFEVHFRADYGSMLELLAFAIEVNYGSFLAELKAKPSVVLQAKAS